MLIGLSAAACGGELCQHCDTVELRGQRAANSADATRSGQWQIMACSLHGRWQVCRGIYATVDHLGLLHSLCVRSHTWHCLVNHVNFLQLVTYCKYFNQHVPFSLYHVMFPAGNLQFSYDS